ncbi:MAG: hypothetical protein KKH98_01425, partial [Spirochaetes bacterium]|nr:hypothetical protein [Spirochaetota bacterium]
IKEIQISRYSNDLHVLLKCDPFSIGMKDLLDTDIIKNSDKNKYMLTVVLFCKDANGRQFTIIDSPFFYFYKTEITTENGNKKFQFFKEHKDKKYVNKLINVINNIKYKEKK